MRDRTPTIAVDGDEHVVQFYEHDSELAETVGRYLIDAVGAGAVAVVIATDTHCRAFAAELRAAGIDPARAVRDGQLVMLDAAATLARFTRAGVIDGAAFDRVIGAILRDAARTGRPIRAYGEMVQLLWDGGDVLAVIELEKLWNDISSRVPFSLRCGYHSSSVSGCGHGEALAQVCHLHSSALRAPGRQDLDTVDGRPAVLELLRQFPAERDAPQAARRLVAAALREWGYDGALLDDAQLVLSELATNAVVHAQSPFVVIARPEGGGVHLSVHDHSPLTPAVRDDGPMAPSGRGLRLVAAVAHSWGVESTSDGKTVWAQLGP